MLNCVLNCVLNGVLNYVCHYMQNANLSKKDHD